MNRKISIYDLDCLMQLAAIGGVLAAFAFILLLAAFVVLHFY